MSSLPVPGVFIFRSLSLWHNARLGLCYLMWFHDTTPPPPAPPKKQTNKTKQNKKQKEIAGEL